MKKTKLLKQVFSIFLLLINLSVYASISQYSLEGEFINYQNGDLADLTITATKVTPSGQISESIEIGHNGKFTINGISFKKLNQIWLSIDDLFYGEILISTDLTITIDYSKLSRSKVTFYGEGIEFGGSDSEATILTNKWISYRRDEKLELESKIQGVSYLNVTEAEKADNLDYLFDKLKKLEDSFLLGYSDSLKWILRDKNQAEHYNQLFLCINKENINWVNLEEALSFTPKILGNSGWLFYNYQSWVLGESYMGSTIFRNWDNQEKNLNKISKHNADFLILSAMPDNLEWKEKYIDKFLPHASQDWVKRHMKEALVLTRNKIEEINKELDQAKNFEKHDKLGKSHKQYKFGADSYVNEEEDILSFISSLQNSFKGEAIIIDLWATWCAPCISDMRNSKPTKKEISNLPLKIIYVCTSQSSNIQNWEKSIAETKVSGTHIYINEKLTSAFMDKFELSGYPSYLFFDSKGEYIKDVIQSISTIDIDSIKGYLNE